MIELVLTVCLLVAPSSCREERSAYEGDSMLACLTQGQIHAARWLEAHPAYSMDRWRCQPAGARGTPI